MKRSAMRTFLAGRAVERERMGPFARRGDEPSRHGVADDVVPFLGVVRVVADARVEEVALEREGVEFREIRFEIPNGFGKATVGADVLGRPQSIYQRIVRCRVIAGCPEVNPYRRDIAIMPDQTGG